MKLSEVNGRVTSIEAKVNTLLAAQAPPADPEVPQDLTDTIVRLEGKLSGVTETPNPS